MEALAYTYSRASREDDLGIEYDLSALDFNKLPRSAGLGLLAFSLLGSSLGAMDSAFAALYVKTRGSCLNARSAPSTSASTLTGICVRNGASLLPVINSRRVNGRLWYQLSSGRWVAADYTSGSAKGGSTSGTGGRLLKPGASGAGVVALQRHLATNGYRLGAGGVDGVYGPSTQAAVKQYQRNNGLFADGIAGPNTLGRMGLGL